MQLPNGYFDFVAQHFEMLRFRSNMFGQKPLLSLIDLSNLCQFQTKFKTSFCYQPQICNRFLKSCQPNREMRMDQTFWVPFSPIPNSLAKIIILLDIIHSFLFCICWMLCPKGLCSSKGSDCLATVNTHELPVKLSSTAIIFPGGRHEAPKAWSINHPWIRDTETSLLFLHQLNAECPIGLCSSKRNDSVACQLK